MDCSEAVEAAAAINPVRAIPMHVWDTDPNEFKSQLEAVCDTKVTLMKPGETLNL
jgi:L-ascorbate metabolism protein UlaG (beta-lactamase superfamily)